MQEDIDSNAAFAQANWAQILESRSSLDAKEEQMEHKLSSLQADLRSVSNELKLVQDVVNELLEGNNVTSLLEWAPPPIGTVFRFLTNSKSSFETFFMLLRCIMDTLLLLIKI